MKLSDLDELRAQAQLDHDKAVSAAADDLAQALAAIDRVKAMLERRAESPAPVETAAEPSDPSIWPGLRHSIRSFIRHNPLGFDLNQVMGHLAAAYVGDNKIDRSAVSGELWRMAKRNEIKVIEKGAGRRPHRYAINPSASAEKGAA